jgi:hypothetical protein
MIHYCMSTWYLVLAVFAFVVFNPGLEIVERCSIRDSQLQPHTHTNQTDRWTGRQAVSQMQAIDVEINSSCTYYKSLCMVYLFIHR